MNRLICCILLLMLAGCGKWVNPNIVDQSEHDKILKDDIEFCKQTTNQIEPVSYRTDDEPPEPTTYEAVYSEDYIQAKTFEDCMKDKGWEKK